MVSRILVVSQVAYRDFDTSLIIGRVIVIEGNKFPIGIPVPGKQNFPCTRDPKIPGTREKKSLLRHTFFKILDL